MSHPWEAPLASMTYVATAHTSGWDHFGNGLIHIVGEEERVSSADLFEYLKVPVSTMNFGHSKTLADIMRRQGWEHGVFKLEGKTVRGYCRMVREYPKTP